MEIGGSIHSAAERWTSEITQQRQLTAGENVRLLCEQHNRVKRHDILHARAPLL